MDQAVEKKSPVLKYIGCGCLGLIVVAVIGGALMVMGFGKAMKSNAPYKDSMVAVQGNAVAIEALGEPIKAGFMPSGNISINNGVGEVSLTIPVSGPKGAGTITVKGSRLDGVWSYDTWQLKVDGQQEVIPLANK